MSEIVFTREGLVHNLTLLAETLSGVQTCYTNNLEELGATLVKVCVYIMDQTRQRAMTKEAT